MYSHMSCLYIRSCIVRSLSALHIHYFFFNDTATTQIYTLSLHDALPISIHTRTSRHETHPRHTNHAEAASRSTRGRVVLREDRKSTRLNSSHRCISYAVFCLKKKIHTCNDIELKNQQIKIKN